MRSSAFCAGLAKIIVFSFFRPGEGTWVREPFVFRFRIVFVSFSFVSGASKLEACQWANLALGHFLCFLLTFTYLLGLLNHECKNSNEPNFKYPKATGVCNCRHTRFCGFPHNETIVVNFHNRFFFFFIFIVIFVRVPVTSLFPFSLVFRVIESGKHGKAENGKTNGKTVFRSN